MGHNFFRVHRLACRFSFCGGSRSAGRDAGSAVHPTATGAFALPDCGIPASRCMRCGRHRRWSPRFIAWGACRRLGRALLTLCRSRASGLLPSRSHRRRHPDVLRVPGALLIAFWRRPWWSRDGLVHYHGLVARQPSIAPTSFSSISPAPCPRDAAFILTSSSSRSSIPSAHWSSSRVTPLAARRNPAARPSCAPRRRGRDGGRRALGTVRCRIHRERPASPRARTGLANVVTARCSCCRCSSLAGKMSGGYPAGAAHAVSVFGRPCAGRDS